MSILWSQPTEITNLPKEIKKLISQKMRIIISMMIMTLAVSRDLRVPVQCQVEAVTNLCTFFIWEKKQNARLCFTTALSGMWDIIYSE